MVFYSIAYTYYDLLLQVSQAGIPFAIATLVAKYMLKEDYKTVLLVKKMGSSVIMALSVVMAFAFVCMSTPLAKQSLGTSAPLEDIEHLRLLFFILAIAVILVPLLSSIRGYVQGLKRLDIYAASQVLEQFARVFTILFGGYIAVIILKLKNIYAIYIAIAAASIGALAAYFFTIVSSKKDQMHIEELAKQQNFDNEKTKKEIVKEILTIGIPFLIISFLSSAGPLVNTTFFMDYITKVNGAQAYESAKLASGILQANIAKISNIPSVLALGFGSGMVPYLSETLESRDFNKLSNQVNQILDTTSFILVPMIVIFIFFARDIYFIMYGNSNLDLGSNLFMVSNIQILLGTIAPIFSSIMMSLKLKKSAIIALIVSFFIKFVTFFPLVAMFGTYGMIYSSGLYYLFQIIMYFAVLHQNYNINVNSSLKKFAIITLASLIMVAPATLIHYFLHFDFMSRVMDIVIMMPLGILMVIVYYFVSTKFNLPQTIFGLEDVSIIGFVKHLGKR